MILRGKSKKVSKTFTELSTLTLLILSLFIGHIIYNTRLNIKIFVIVLQRIPERKRNVQSQLRGFTYTVIPAVDGAHLTTEDQLLREKYVVGGKFNNAQIGCLLSHVTVWKRIIKDRISVALILEDDLKNTPSLKKLLPHLVDQMGNSDLMYIGHCHEDANGLFIQAVSNYSIRASVHPYCTHAYLITNTGARKLIGNLEINKTRVHVDDMMVNAYNNGVVRAYSVIPALINQTGFKSTIGYPVNQTIQW